MVPFARSVCIQTPTCTVSGEKLQDTIIATITVQAKKDMVPFAPSVRGLNPKPKTYRVCAEPIDETARVVLIKESHPLEHQAVEHPLPELPRHLLADNGKLRRSHENSERPDNHYPQHPRHLQVKVRIV